MALAVRGGVGEAVSAGGALVRGVGEAVSLNDGHALPGLVRQSKGHLVPLRVRGQELALAGDAPVGPDFQVPDLGRTLRGGLFSLLAEQRRSAPGQQYRRQCQQGGGFCQMVFHRKIILLYELVRE